jgi:hypothetical protein
MGEDEVTSSDGPPVAPASLRAEVVREPERLRPRDLDSGDEVGTDTIGTDLERTWEDLRQVGAGGVEPTAPKWIEAGGLEVAGEDARNDDRAAALRRLLRCRAARPRDGEERGGDRRC